MLDIVTQITILVALVGIGIAVLIADGVEPNKLNLEEYHWSMYCRILYMRPHNYFWGWLVRAGCSPPRDQSC